jgi:hypothetical protein
MPIAAVFTIIGAVLTVLVLAAYLISIAFVLARVNAKLGAINDGLQLVTEKTKPLEPIVGEINRDLAGVDNALRAVLAR